MDRTRPAARRTLSCRRTGGLFIRQGKLIAFAAAGAILAAGLGGGWHWWRERQLVALVRAALPPIPDLAAWPPEYAARVRAATAAANRLDQPVAALGELACLYHANSFYREAAQAERGLLAWEPKDARWAYYLAETSEKLGDADAQRAFLEKTVRLAPYYPTARLSLADLLLKLGLPDEARVQYDRFLALAPDEPHGRLGLARIALERGDRRLARNELETLVRDHPDFPAAHNLLAEVYAAMGDGRRADEQRRLSGATGEGLRLDDPWLAWVYAWSFDAFRLEARGGGPLQNRQLETALRFYQKAVRLAPGDGLAYDALGNVFLQRNELENAIATLESGIAAAPRTAGLYATLARALRRQGHVTKTIALLKRGVSVVWRDPGLRYDLGAILEENGRRAEAAASYRIAVRLNPDFVEARWKLGLCLLALGEDREARADLGRALDLQPRKADELSAVAEKALAAGNLEQAGSCIHALIEHSPGTPVRQLVERGLALAHQAGDARAGGDFKNLLTQSLP